MKTINKIFSILLIFMLTFSVVWTFGQSTIHADDSDYKIDAAGTLVKYNGEGNKIEIPKGVKIIGEKAFWGNKHITVVKMPDTVKEIKQSAFESCTELKEVVLSKNLTTIADSAFYGCASLNKITLPKSLKTVGFSAFGNCTSLDGIYIPKGVEEINSYAFGYNLIGGYTQTPGFMVMGEGYAQIYAQKYGFPFATLKDLAVTPVSLKKASKTQAKLAWKKNTKVDKFQIQVSTSKKFSDKKTYSVANTDVKSKLIPSLKKGTTYYVRVRGVKSVAGTTYNSKWSKIKTIKMK